MEFAVNIPEQEPHPGQATFSMEFFCYRRTPGNVQEEVIASIREKQAAKQAASGKKK